MGIGIALVSESVRCFSANGVTYRDLSPEPTAADVNALARSNDTNVLIPVFIEHLMAAAKTAY
jgi:hypothetical protein